MPQRDIIVIGASSGGVHVLTQLVRGLPEQLPAAVFVVLHVPPDTPSHLPAILNRSGPLPASHAVDQEPIRRGRIYVAPPGMQMYLQSGRISVRRGPRENSQRPAIDALFRTAAHHYGPRVIGVVLSGSLDDGAAGLYAVKRGAGIAVVQDPADAEFPDMPANALDRTQVDYAVSTEDLASTLIGLVAYPITNDALRPEIPLETVEEAPKPADALRSAQLGRASDLTCPDCHGTLYEIGDAGTGLRYRCRVGHAFSPESLDAAQTDSVERALWAALRALEERTALMRKLAEHARRRGHGSVAELFEVRSDEVERDVKAIHEVITTGRTLEPVGDHT